MRKIVEISTKEVEPAKMQCLGKLLSFEEPKIMGILNVTPDSFFDGGKYYSPDVAVDRALQMVEEGAEIIDLGGESSGPGSEYVSSEEEIARVVPVVEKLRSEFNGIISIDTYKSEVARAALEAGADMINDILAGRGDEEMFNVVAEYGAGYCMMFSKDDSARTSREDTSYEDVVASIYDFLKERIAVAVSSGVKREQICVDPGMGAFISTNGQYSLEVLRAASKFRELGPVLIGTSRKGFIGEICGGEDASDRLVGSVMSGAWAAELGADILRVHDVKETSRAIKMLSALTKGSK